MAYNHISCRESVDGCTCKSVLVSNNEAVIYDDTTSTLYDIAVVLDMLHSEHTT